MLLHPLAIFDGNMRNDSGAREKQRLRQDESVVPIGELGELEKAVVSNRCLGRGTGPKWQRGFVALSAHPHVVLIELDVPKAWVPVDHGVSSMPLNPADRSAHSMHAEGGHNNEKRHCRIEPGWHPSGGVHVHLPFAVSRLIRSQTIMGSRLARCNHTGRGHSKKGSGLRIKAASHDPGGPNGTELERAICPCPQGSFSVRPTTSPSPPSVKLPGDTIPAQS